MRPTLFAASLPKADLAGLRAHLGARPRVIAWGMTLDGFVVALEGRFAWGALDDWTSVGWHEIATGGWDNQTKTLRLRTVTEDSQEFELSEVGRVPEAFRERVGASLVLEQHGRGPGGVDVLFTARRDLSIPQAPLAWEASATDGRTLDRPGLAEFAAAALKRLQEDVEGAP